MKKISFNIGHFCKKYGDKGVLDFAKSIGADCVDYDLLCFDNCYRNIRKYSSGLYGLFW